MSKFYTTDNQNPVNKIPQSRIPIVPKNAKIKPFNTFTFKSLSLFNWNRSTLVALLKQTSTNLTHD